MQEMEAHEWGVADDLPEKYSKKQFEWEEQVEAAMTLEYPKAIFIGNWTTSNKAYNAKQQISSFVEARKLPLNVLVRTANGERRVYIQPKAKERN